ncbi:MAG: RNA polymerase sigma-70 factor [Muribaculaceae bacterium]|nr:RNA polymerase sigma-70 factor [Muribaculaceae bacterium]
MTSRQFDIFFRRTYLPLGMYALRIVNDAEAAEDLVEDAFVKLWQMLCDGATVENPKAYMYRAVRNGCISYLRGKRETVSIDTVPEADDESVDTSERDAAIWRAIDALPKGCREVFLLSKRDGLSNDEIADELGISVKTVKNQMTKAFSRLRDALSPSYKPFFLPFL